MSRRVPQLLVALVALFAVVAIVAALRDGDDAGTEPTSTPSPAGSPTTGPPASTAPVPTPQPTPTLTPEELAVAAATTFLDRYVEPDGRVRRDPDGDTVSEGQAYAMLLAVAADDPEVFDRVWAWTQDNLLRRDGTLAWRWMDGRVVDPNAATDADLDAGRALLLAADAFGEPRYRDDAVALGEAVLRHGVITTAIGPVLVAGPWAVEAPHYINPSYFSEVAFEQLGAATGDVRWRRLAATSSAVLRELTQDGRLLPSDWALVDPDGTVTPSAPPGGGTAAYSYDAFRTLPRLAEACNDDDRQLAASLVGPAMRTLEAPSDTAGLDGSAMTEGDNQLYRIGAAAAAHAAGDLDRYDELIAQADQANAEAPSYYLGAWVALTRVLLDTDTLGGCATPAPDQPAAPSPDPNPTREEDT